MHADASAPAAIYDTEYYLALCEDYLAEFFGADWETDDAFDGTTSPEQSFTRRNDKDKRYRTAEQKAMGVEGGEGASEKAARGLSLRARGL